jgi:hypothetical protein
MAAERSEWQHQVVVTRNRAGDCVLLAIRKTECEECGYGVEFDTLWGSTLGEAHRITWCASCFNALCERVELDEGQRSACYALVKHIAAHPPATYWCSARPAVEDLERRGLV